MKAIKKRPTNAKAFASSLPVDDSLPTACSPGSIQARREGFFYQRRGGLAGGAGSWMNKPKKKGRSREELFKAPPKDKHANKAGHVCLLLRSTRRIWNKSFCLCIVNLFRQASFLFCGRTWGLVLLVTVSIFVFQIPAETNVPLISSTTKKGNIVLG